jgi:hypothetical protein
MHNTGSVVSKLAATPLIPVLAWIVCSKGATDVITGRKFKAAKKIAASK